MHNALLSFPANFEIGKSDAIDIFIKQLAIDYDWIFEGIKKYCILFITTVNDMLEATPWWVFILGVILLTYFLTRKISTAASFGVMVFAIGCFGMWDKMLETLSLVIVAVIISLILGFPIGILVAMSARAERIVRPVLDLMQTMPAWVYLVPAIILFSVGKTPALIATVIYSIVPFIRMTSHGISHVDREVVEASVAFGSTRMQTLGKVQIPQALPTIMTGVNQTIMMAMSMVVTCALIGADGLGMEILVATNRVEMGNSLLPGISIVFLAIILDRLTQSLVKKDATAKS